MSESPAGTPKPGEYAWVVIREGREPVIMQRGSQHQWFLPGSEQPYYAGDIWDIAGPVERLVLVPAAEAETPDGVWLMVDPDRCVIDLSQEPVLERADRTTWVYAEDGSRWSLPVVSADPGVTRMTGERGDRARALVVSAEPAAEEGQQCRHCGDDTYRAMADGPLRHKSTSETYCIAETHAELGQPAEPSGGVGRETLDRLADAIEALRAAHPIHGNNYGKYRGYNQGLDDAAALVRAEAGEQR